jgi:hypothetical protein
MIVKLDESSTSLVLEVEQRIKTLCGYSATSHTMVIQVLLKTACAGLSDATIKEIAPQTQSLAQQRKSILKQMRALAGEIDASQIAKIERTLDRIRRPADDKLGEKKE